MDSSIEKINGITINKEVVNRNKKIVKVSIVGIIANVFLAIFKAIVGILSDSIAIVLDAVNNISDAASSIITIIGTKLANKEPDRKHPFGYGRIEYLSAMIIAIIVLYAGVTSLVESVKKIIKPSTPEYTTISFIIIGIAVLVKIFLGRYVKASGKKLNSQSLVNSGDDATLDSIISLSTLIAAIIFALTGLSLEAYLGTIISLVIIKSGIEMLGEAISSILGERVDIDLVRDINQIIYSFKEVKGVYDLILNNYGPDYFTGSVHIEVVDTMTADKIDSLIRNITSKVYLEKNVMLTAVGIYSINTKSKEVMDAKKKLQGILSKYKSVLQFHGLYFDEDKKIMRFDIVVDFDEKDRAKLYKDIYDEVSKEFKKYQVIIALDTDFSVSMD